MSGRPEKPTNLADMLVTYRKTNRLSVRDLAKNIGTSSATLSRIEQGYSMDAKTLVKVLNWAMSTRVLP